MAWTTKQKVWAGVGGAAVLIGGTVFVMSRNKKNEAKKQQQQGVTAATSAVDAILKNNPKVPPELQQIPSYTAAQYKAFADTMQGAMKGAGTWEEEDIEEVFNGMQHDLDVYLLIDAFGVRDEENLATWLSGDGMTSRINNVLKTKGRVTFRF